MRYDFAIHDESGRPLVVLEAKAQQRTSPRWASRFRRNLFTHFGKPDTEFFGIVTPDFLYLWREDHASAIESPPDFQLDLSGYFSDFPPEALRGQAFEWVVSSWLSELPEIQVDEWSELKNSGLVEALRHGRMQIKGAA